MKLTLIVLCAFAVIFLLRVLAALVKECMSPPPRAMKTYLAKFQPSRTRRELVVMHPDVRTLKFPSRTGERIALGLIAIPGFMMIGFAVETIVKL